MKPFMLMREVAVTLIIQGSALLRNFLSNCDLIEFKLQSHCFTRFRGGFMSRINRAFTSLEFHLQFPFFSLYRYLRGMSDHCQLLLQTSKVHWGIWTLSFGRLIGRLRIFEGKNPAKTSAKRGIRTPVSSTFRQVWGMATTTSTRLSKMAEF
jgi:hypothetical protein